MTFVIVVFVLFVIVCCGVVGEVRQRPVRELAVEVRRGRLPSRTRG